MSQLVRLAFRQVTIGFVLTAGCVALLLRMLNGLVFARIPSAWVSYGMGKSGRHDHKNHLLEYRPIPVRVDDRQRRPF